MFIAHEVHNLAEMHALGTRLGKALHKGDVLLLHGTLGAGKTSLVQGIGKALGIDEITSPTFVISKSYPGLIHVDAYRLVGEPAALFDDLDLDSQMSDAITVIEWGDGFVERVTDEYLEIAIEFGKEESDRTVTMVGHGKRWEEFSL
jgi:tRNA threonylcarbamoyladenosine biosynthesis protein TsaE